MRLTTLGTGTVALQGDRACAGHLVQAGAVVLLMDCGSGTCLRLAEHGLPWAGITHVAFTHFHTDHISDFATLMQAWRYGQLPPRAAPLTVVGPAGTGALLDRIATMHGDWVRQPGFELAVVELAPGAAHDLGDGVTLSVVKVPHSDESVALLVSRGRARLAYTGDMGYDPMVAEALRGMDLLLCECSLPESMAMDGHMTPARCGALAAAALPRHLVLTHLYPPVERTDVRATIAAHYAGPVTIAADGSGFEIEED